jgi:hypothetical protein
MNCHEFRGWLDDLLIRDPGEATPADVARHLDECDACARRHALALETLAAITPKVLIGASPRLKEQIMRSIPSISLDGLSVELPFGPRRFGETPNPDSGLVVAHRRAGRVKWAGALAAGVLLAVCLFPFGGAPWGSSNGLAWNLLAEASAAEARLFTADRLVSLNNEIVVEPVEDAELLQARWLPILSIQADGKPRLDQLKLAGELGKGYTIRDQSWYDPASHRFARVLSVGGRPLFAYAFDGRAVHHLEIDDQGRSRIKDRAITADFRPPQSPAEFLGIVAGLTSMLDRPDHRDLVRDEGTTKLGDGSSVRLVKVISPDNDPKSYVLATIRDDNHTIESIDLVVRGQTLYRVRRARAGEDREPEYGWDLAGLRRALGPDEAKSPVQILANMVVPNVSVEAMLKRADYPTYVLGKDPGWAGPRQIVDILDVASPPHRMFAAIYPAKDKRHVILLQAFTFNSNLGPKARSGKLVYTSPAGIKVWSGERDQSLAEILLSSARFALGDPPAKDRTGYLLETPDNTFPALAVNGPLTEAELHALVDSLVPVKAK